MSFIILSFTSRGMSAALTLRWCKCEGLCVVLSVTICHLSTESTITATTQNQRLKLDTFPCSPVLLGLTARRDDASSEQEKSAPALDACSDHLFSPPLLACPSHKLVSTRNSHHHILSLYLYLSLLSRSSALRLPRPALTLLPCSAALSDTQHTTVQPSPLLLCCWLARPPPSSSFLLPPSSFLLPPSSNRPSLPVLHRSHCSCRRCPNVPR